MEGTEDALVMVTEKGRYIPEENARESKKIYRTSQVPYRLTLNGKKYYPHNLIDEEVDPDDYVDQYAMCGYEITDPSIKNHDKKFLEHTLTDINVEDIFLEDGSIKREDYYSLQHFFEYFDKHASKIEELLRLYVQYMISSKPTKFSNEIFQKTYQKMVHAHSIQESDTSVVALNGEDDYPLFALLDTASTKDGHHRVSKDLFYCGVIDRNPITNKDDIIVRIITPMEICRNLSYNSPAGYGYYKTNRARMR